MHSPESTLFPEIVIHVGAGSGQRVREFQQAGAKRIVLLEAEAAMAADLSKRASEDGEIHVIAAAAADKDGHGVLSIWNLPELNSLVPPKETIHQLYPSLRLIERQEVQLVGPEGMMADLGDHRGSIFLVVQAPGMEATLLNAWKATGHLDRIELLEVHCAQEPQYEGQASRVELEEWLIAEGFAVTARSLEDPDWPILYLRADHKGRDLARATSRVNELLEQLADREKALANAETKLNAAADRAAVLNKGLADAKAATDAKTAALADVETQLKDAADRAAVLDKSLVDAKAETDAKGAALADAETKLKAATDRATVLEKGLADAKAATDLKAAAFADAESKLKAAADRAAALEKSLVDAKAATDTKGAALADAETKLKAAADRAAVLDKGLADAKAATDAKTAALADAETKLKAAADRAAALDKGLADAKAATDAKAAALADAETKLKAATDRAAAIDRSLIDAKGATDAKAAALADAETKLKAATERTGVLDKALAAARSQNTLLVEDSHRDQMDARSARQDLGLALRLQNKLQSDLRDLQARFEVLQSVRAEYDELLQQLTPRLRAAAQQLQTLPLQSPKKAPPPALASESIKKIKKKAKG
ncbi:MAG: hypothetical protein Q8M31_06765 [Beijerinckiaceae bacterium]|nr:hypothetical protein [Beijerinckiaceae bacterium]